MQGSGADEDGQAQADEYGRYEPVFNFFQGFNDLVMGTDELAQGTPHSDQGQEDDDGDGGVGRAMVRNTGV